MNTGGCFFVILIIAFVIIAFVMFYSWNDGDPQIKDTAPNWLQKTHDEQSAKARCTQFLETFHDNRLLEIVKLDVAGWTMRQIADRYNISEHCLKTRIDRDRKLYKAIKAEYIVNPF